MANEVKIPSGAPTRSEVAFRIGSGTLAGIGVLVVPTLIGWYVDQRLGWFIFMPLGLIVGMFGALVILIRLAQKWTPAARRSKNEIPFDDNFENNDIDDDRRQDE